MTEVRTPSGEAPRPRVRWESGIDLAVAGALTLFAAVVYVLTLTLTIPFWDSGEFIATSYVLGIPHPPGTPLYVILGRVFSLLPVPLTISQKVNLLSAIPSAMAVGLSYLVTARILAHCRSPFGTEGTWPPRPTHLGRIGAVVGALVMAFSSTYWTNATEAEVYPLSSLVMTGSIYLMLKWRDLRHQGRQEAHHAMNVVIAVFYMLALSIAFHMGAFVVFLPLVLFFLSDYYPDIADRRFVASAALLVILSFFLGFDAARGTISLVLVSALVMINYSIIGSRNLIGLVGSLGTLIVATIILAKMGPVFGGVVALLLVGTLVALWGRGLVRDNLGMWVGLVFVLGLSVHIFLLVRAAHDPPINEADPSTLDNFLKVLTRDQYKPGPPWEFRGGFDTDLQRAGMQVRDAQGFVVPFGERLQAELDTKFNTHFWRYWRPQYELGMSLLWAVPFVLGALGGVFHYLRSRRTFLMMAFVLLATSVGLIWHLNFKADEVRDRDYFFVAFFHFFTIWVGIGAAGLLSLVRDAVPAVARPVGIGVTSFALMVIPLGQLEHQWFEHDRSEFYVARDYAYNLLEPLPPDAILFTNGDNDTFPLWCLQEVYGVRKDVRVACLSLLNTDWYIKQCRDQEPTVPITWTDAQVDDLVPFWDQEIQRPILVKDQAVYHIVQNNRGARPIYFAVSVPDLMGFQEANRLEMEGLSWRLTDAPVEDDVDVEVLRENLYETFRWGGLLTDDFELDRTVYRDPNTRRLSQNYAAAFIRLGMGLEREARDLYEAGDDAGGDARIDDAIEQLRRAEVFYDGYTASSIVIATLLQQRGRAAEADSILTGFIGYALDHPGSRESDYVPELFYRRAILRFDQGDFAAAYDDYASLTQLLPQEWQAWEGQIQALAAMGQRSRAVQVVDTWLATYPNHQPAKDVRKRLAGGGVASEDSADTP